VTGIPPVAEGEVGTALFSSVSVVAHQELFFDVEAVADGEKGLSLALLGALTVADVQRCDVVIASCKRGADAGIHASAEEDDGAGLFWLGHGFRRKIAD
jgi:hypothetical protein